MQVTPENANEVLPEGYRMKVRHLHDGNDPMGTKREAYQDRVRDKNGYFGNDPRTPRFVTVAQVTSKKDDEPPTVEAEGYALCVPEDSPNRRLGWTIAASRAVEAFFGKK